MDGTIVEALRTFILAELSPHEDAELGPDTLLFDAGILDSVAALALIEFIEERFGVALEAHELSVETFGSLSRIASLVEGKRAASA